jgi:hypothetical protein
LAYVRTRKVPGPNGPYTYYQLVEGYREDGKVKQRVLRHLGRFDSIEAARRSVVMDAARRGVVANSTPENPIPQQWWIWHPSKVFSHNGLQCFPVFLSQRAAHRDGRPNAEALLVGEASESAVQKFSEGDPGAGMVAILSEKLPKDDPAEVMPLGEFLEMLRRFIPFEREYNAEKTARYQEWLEGLRKGV